MIHTSKSTLFAALKRGEKCDVSVDLFDDFMEVLPPVYMLRRVELVSGERVNSQFGYAEGADAVTAFWREGGRLWAQHTKEVNRG